MGTRSGYTLRFTGNCNQEEFESRCKAAPYWYHSFYFDNGFAQKGDYDIGQDIETYGFPSDMTGMSVLDVGTGSGWFATYFEQRGASVTTLDVRGHCDHDVFGRPGYPDVFTEKPTPDRVLPDGHTVYYSYCSQGFWIMKEMLGLRAEFVNARIYDINPKLFGGRLFDLVFIGSLLMHLRDPIGALMACRSVARDRLIATSWDLADQSADLRSWSAVSEDVPLMRLMTDTSPVYWWKPNQACLNRWFTGAGFSKVDCKQCVTVSADFASGPDALKATTHRQTLVHAAV